MQVLVITVGEYDDRRIVGVATSAEQAAAVIAAARQSGEFTHLEWSGGQDTYDVTGPYVPGSAYEYAGKVIGS